jgi:hypothetical protein
MSFLCSIWQASRFVVRTHTMERAGARVGTVKDGVLSAIRKVLDGSEYDGRACRGRDDRSRGELASGATNIRGHILVFGGSETRTMMQYAHRQRSSEAADPYSQTALEAIGTCGDPTTSNRHRRPAASLRTGPETVTCTSAISLQCTGRRVTPSGTTPSRTKCHKAIRSLRAKATIIFLREPRAFSVRASNHLVRALSFW